MSRFQRVVAMIFLVTLLGRVLGFVRNLYVSAAYGTGLEASAYYAAVVIPMTLWVVFPGAVNALFIPTMKGVMATGDREREKELYSKVLTLTILVSGALSLLGWLLTGPVTNLLVPGFSANGKALVGELLVWMWPSLLFIGLMSLWSSVLNAHDRFFSATLSGVVNSVVTILCFLILVPQFGVIGLAISTTVGFAMGTFTMLPSLVRLSIPFRWNFRWRHDPDLRSMGERFVPILIGLILGQITVFFEKILGSGLGEEKISALAYAMTIVQLPMMVVGAVTVPLFPLLSEHVKKQNLEEMKRILNLGLRYIVVLLVPVSAGFIVLGKPLVRFLYEGNQFGAHDTDLTYWALMFYGLGLFAMAGRDLVTRGFYALEDTRTPMVAGAVVIVIYIGLGLGLVRFLDHGGIALAMALSMIANLILLCLTLRRKIGPFVTGEFYRTAGKSVVASLVMALAVQAVQAVVPFPRPWLAFTALSVVGMLVYGVALFLVKEPLLNRILADVKQRAARLRRRQT